MWHEAAHRRLLSIASSRTPHSSRSVDTNRVYITGYSAGGDGVYQIGPRMADRWAAAAMMAGHPNDASPVNLRNVPFAIHVGELDAAFNRNKIGAEWGAKLDELRAADPEGYAHLTEIHKGRPHWMNREDASAIPWMAAHTRNPWPARVVWRQDDVVSPRLYWLRVDPKDAKAGDTITASVSNNTITLTLPASLPAVTLLLNDALVDLDRPVIVKVDGRTVHEGVVPRTAAAIRAGLESRADVNAAPTAELTIRN
jgi:dienelactone hydrolase